MRATLLTAALGLFALAAPARADEATDLIKKAITAHGGEAALDKADSFSAKQSGTINIMGADVKAELAESYQAPDKLKVVVVADFMGQKINLVQLLNGKKAAMRVNGMQVPLPEAVGDEFRHGAYVQKVTKLTPLLKDQTFKLKYLGESEDNGKKYQGVSVNAEGQREVKLFFDKSTGLIGKYETESLDQGGQKAQSKTYLSGYKAVEGLQVPFKTVSYQGETKQVDAEVTEYKVAPKFGASEFSLDD